MNDQEFHKCIATKKAQHVLDFLAGMPAKERSKFAKVAMKLYKELDRAWMLDGDQSPPQVHDTEAVSIALLATAPPSALKKLSYFPSFQQIPIEKIFTRLAPNWTQEIVDHFVDVQTFYVGRFRPLWQAGLCQRPQSDAVILHYYTHSSWSSYSEEADGEAFFGGDVWRFFEVEGGGEDSLANHDKFLKSGQESWADRLKRFSDEGKLDRQKLLDASLKALQRDFAQYRAGWYSRFHVLMAPTEAEIAARADDYLRLLGSSIPPTVSFALKHVQKLDSLGAIEASVLVAALDPVLQARGKGVVTSALRLLLSAAKQDPSLQDQVARQAVLALISEDAGIQGKALDVIEAMGVETVQDELGPYVDMVAPSVRPRIVALIGAITGDRPREELPITGTPVISVEPVARGETALALFLKVLEDPRDPLEVERAIDGISRFGVQLGSDQNALSPLRKRAEQLCAKHDQSELGFVLALTGRALAEGVPLTKVVADATKQKHPLPLVTPLSLQEFHLQRNIGVIDRVMMGQELPLLALPSQNSGMVGADQLLERIDLYRQAGVAPDHHDLALALMRLDRNGAFSGELSTTSEADRAIAYALGREVKTGPSPELWAAAWCARSPDRGDQSIAKLFKKPLKFLQSDVPDCGVPAKMDLVVTKIFSGDGQYSWIEVQAPVQPVNAMKSRALPALFCSEIIRYSDASPCGYTFADIAWASLVRPSHQEPFFRMGLIQQDSWQKLSDNPTRAFLEPFFRPGPNVGALGAGLLSYFMAVEDKSVSALAIDAVAVLSSEDRLSADVFVSTLQKFLMSHSLPTGRWTKALKGVAELGAGTFARKVIVGLLDFQPSETPKDIGGLLELCFELHIAQEERLLNPKAIATLRAIPGGGKTAKFSKKLLELSEA